MSLSEILTRPEKPALFVGNGINRYNNGARSSWDDLLGGLMRHYGVNFTDEEIREMSNTELVDPDQVAAKSGTRSGCRES